jgi:hypothetical protein
MRRPFVTLTCALVVALAPVALFAQDPPAQQQPPAQPATPQPPKLAFTAEAGIFLLQIKPDQTATFEELMNKVKDALAKSEDPVRRQQATGWKVYKSSEGMGTNALYVVVLDPAVKGAGYDPLVILSESLGKDAGTPENQAMLKKYADAFAGVNQLNMSPLISMGGM